MRTYKPREKSLPAKFTPGFMKRLDGRQALAVRLRTSFDNIVEDLGGEQNLTYTRLVMIERFVFLEAMIANWEAQVATEPDAADALVGRMVQATNSLQGLARVIGYERRDAGPITLQAYVRAKEEA